MIDIGTSLCKGGYSGEDTPKAVFPTDFGVCASESNGDIVMADEQNGSASSSSAASGKKSKRYIGDGEVICPRAGMEIRNPISAGLISDWEAMEHLWDYMFTGKLRVNSQEVSEGRSAAFIPSVWGSDFISFHFICF